MIFPKQTNQRRFTLRKAPISAHAIRRKPCASEKVLHTTDVCFQMSPLLVRNVPGCHIDRNRQEHPHVRVKDKVCKLGYCTVKKIMVAQTAFQGAKQCCQCGEHANLAEVAHALLDQPPLPKAICKHQWYSCKGMIPT
mmetsp:Transcript_29093/g.66930  ORF Transcript_29093/g.66930 Transcript_29093/m.66930 type:complete len:138 (-) Transcript_29093:450-863(-)